jgi:glycosyltransferase involved in cell wall biosynthesis
VYWDNIEQQKTNSRELSERFKVSELKILLTVHQFFPEYASGTEVLTYSVAKELCAQGHQVFVFTGFPAATHLEDSDRFDQYALDGIKVFRFHHAAVPMGGQPYVTELEYCNLLAASYFKRLVVELNPDVIHFFHLSRLGAALMDVAFSSGIPSYYTPTDFWAVCPTSQLLLADGKMCAGPTKFAGNCVKHVIQLTRGKKTNQVVQMVPERIAEGIVWLAARDALPAHPAAREVGALSRRKEFILKRLNALNKIIAPTQLMSNVLIENGVNDAKIIKSAYGIDTTYYDEFSRAEKTDDLVTIGFIGTLATHKGCHVLLKAIALLKDERNLRVKIYGRGTDFPDYYAQLQDLAATDPRIEFCGTFPNDEIGVVLSKIDVLVVPSLWYENTPLVIYSALASGCPVVASNFAGMAEAIQDGVNGMLFNPGDAQDLSEMLCKLGRDKNVLRDLRKNCKKPKSTHQYVNELLALYLEEKQNARIAGSVPQDRGPWLKLEPFVSMRECGAITGWAVMQRRAPTAMRLIVDGVLVSEVRDFAQRVDVLEGFKKQGMRIKSASIGFILKFPAGIDRSKAVLELVAKSGENTTIALDRIGQGRSSGFENEVYLGLDSENWL